MQKESRRLLTKTAVVHHDNGSKHKAILEENFRSLTF